MKTLKIRGEDEVSIFEVFAHPRLCYAGASFKTLPNSSESVVKVLLEVSVEDKVPVLLAGSGGSSKPKSVELLPPEPVVNYEW